MRRRFSSISLLTAFVAALVLPGNRPGIGVVVVGVSLAAAILVSERATTDLLVFGSAAVLLTAMTAVRAAEWVVALDLLAAAGLSVVAMTGLERWADLARAPVSAMVALFRAPALVVRPLVPTARTGRRAIPVLRGAVVGLALVVVFGVLFASADAAFSRLARRFLIPSFDAELLPMQIVAFVATAVAAGTLAALRVPLELDIDPWGDARAPARERRQGSRVEWVVALGLLDLLFAAFVAVQLAFLFGGHDLVQRTVGLTYAEYARQGFFQLLVVGALVLAVVAGAVRWAALHEPRDRVLLKAFLGALCLLTLVILASALRRMGLYEDAFGLTRARVLADAVAMWLGAVVVMVMAAGVRWRGRWLPRAVLALSALAMLAFSLSNPDGRIAESNLSRWRGSGRLDRVYLRGLSADATPVVVRELGAGAEVLAGMRQDLGRRDPWPSWNLARERARSALRTG